MKVKSESEVAQSCLTPSDTMDCISTLILGKPENNDNDLWPLGYERLVLRGPQVHTPGFHPL